MLTSTSRPRESKSGAFKKYQKMAIWARWKFQRGCTATMHSCLMVPYYTTFWELCQLRVIHQPRESPEKSAGQIINVNLLFLGCTPPSPWDSVNSRCINDLKFNFNQMKTLSNISQSTPPVAQTHRTDPSHPRLIHSKHLWSWLLIYRRLLIWHSLRTDHWGSGVSSRVRASVRNLKAANRL